MPEEKKLCLCGCDKEINIFDKRGKERFYILGHQLRGNKFRLGKPRPDFIDGRSKLKCPDRYGDDWDAIRLIVYMRDNYRCQGCGITMNDYKRPLDIHHKVPFLISRDNSLSNLITLCRSCHMKIENQFIEQQKVMLRA